MILFSVRRVVSRDFFDFKPGCTNVGLINTKFPAKYYHNFDNRQLRVVIYMYYNNLKIVKCILQKVNKVIPPDSSLPLRTTVSCNCPWVDNYALNFQQCGLCRFNFPGKKPTVN